MDPRTLLVNFLGDTPGLTGTHVGCDTSRRGACELPLDGRPARRLHAAARQAAGARVTTIEGIGDGDALRPVQQAAHDTHARQWGYCTPGVVNNAIELLARYAHPDAARIRRRLDGHLCRRRGYRNSVRPMADAAAAIRHAD